MIIIYADDLGYADVGVQGCKDLATPNLDRIANEGVRFTSGYVMPWCAPARSTLITGCWPGRGGSGRIGRPVPVPLPKLFEQAGYATAVYGKIHGHDTTGFQDALYFGSAGNYPEHPRDGKPNYGTLIQNGKPYVVNEYPTDLFTRLGVEWIKKNKDRPFLLYLPYQVAKLTVKPTAELLKRAGNIPGRDDPFHGKIDAALRRALAAAMIGMDDGVGKRLETLKECGVEDNTIVCFASDNGGGDPKSLNTSLRGGKCDLYDGGIRVPFFIRWPAQFKAGTVYDRPISIADVLVTALAAAGAKPALDSVDGVNIVPYVKGEAKGDPHRYLFWDPRVAGKQAVGSAAVRSGRWKLVRNPQTKAWELYDVEQDIGETKDLAAQHPDVVKDLTGALERWQQTGKP